MVKSNTNSDEKRKSYAVIQISGHGNTPSVQDGNKLYDESLEHGIIRFFTDFLNSEKQIIKNNPTAEELASQVLQVNEPKSCIEKSSAYFITAVPHGVSNMMFAGSLEQLSSPARQFQLLYDHCDTLMANKIMNDEKFYEEIGLVKNKLRDEHTYLLTLYLKDVINAYNKQVIRQNTVYRSLKLLPNPFLTDEEKQTEIDEYKNKIKVDKSSRNHRDNNFIEMFIFFLADAKNYFQRPKEQEKYYFNIVQYIHKYNKQNGLKLTDLMFRFINNDLYLVDIVFNTTNDSKDKKRLYMCQSFEPDLPNLSFNIKQPSNENDAYDFLYGIRMAYLNYDGRNNVAASNMTMRSQAQLQERKEINPNYRTKTDYNNYSQHLKIEENNELKQLVKIHISARINVGKVFLSELYILFKWCYGIDKIAFFTPACRNSVIGYKPESKFTASPYQPKSKKRNRSRTRDESGKIMKTKSLDEMSNPKKKMSFGGKIKRTRKQRKLKKRVKK